MAEEEKKKGIISKILPTKNVFKRVLRRFGFPVHYTQTPGFDIREIPTYKELDKEINFKVISELNRTMVLTEQKWDGIPSKDRGPKPEDKCLETQASAGFIRDRIIDIYSEEGGKLADGSTDITTSIGPWTDKTALVNEGDAVANGTGISDISQEMIIKLKNGQKITSEFSIPKEKPIYFNDGRMYKVAFFGARSNVYWDKINKEIDDICRKVLEASLASENNHIQKQNINSNVTIINKKIKDWLGLIMAFEREFEGKHRSMLVGKGGVIKHWNIAEKLRAQIMKLKFTDEQVHYTHTYKVVLPRIPKTIETGNPIKDDDGNKIGEKVEYVFKKDENIEYEELKDYVPADWKRDNEVDYGLDENGYSLEVGDGETKFEGKVIPKNAVLIDVFEGRTPRFVPKDAEKFIVNCDLPDIAMWIYVHYDSYRDDLRDARYHEKAITIMDRIMTELKIPDIKHLQTIKNIKEGEQTKITLDLNNVPSRPQSVEMSLYSTHLNPALDHPERFKKVGIDYGKTKHWGKKYYYDIPDMMFREQSPYPTITTRGAALYILHRVIEKAKYWDGKGDPSKAGVVDLMQAIGEITDGFDIGPNIGPGFSRWGTQLTRNPFKPF